MKTYILPWEKVKRPQDGIILYRSLPAVGLAVDTREKQRQEIKHNGSKDSYSKQDKSLLRAKYLQQHRSVGGAIQHKNGFAYCEFNHMLECFAGSGPICIPV